MFNKCKEYNSKLIMLKDIANQNIYNLIDEKIYAWCKDVFEPEVIRFSERGENTFVFKFDKELSSLCIKHKDFAKECLDVLFEKAFVYDISIIENEVDIVDTVQIVINPIQK